MVLQMDAVQLCFAMIKWRRKKKKKKKLEHSQLSWLQLCDLFAPSHFCQYFEFVLSRVLNRFDLI